MSAQFVAEYSNQSTVCEQDSRAADNSTWPHMEVPCSGIASWLKVLKLEKYDALFAGLDVKDVAHMTAQQLSDLGLPLGPRRKIQINQGIMRGSLEPFFQAENSSSGVNHAGSCPSTSHGNCPAALRRPNPCPEPPLKSVASRTQQARPQMPSKPQPSPTHASLNLTVTLASRLKAKTEQQRAVQGHSQNSSASPSTTSPAELQFSSKPAIHEQQPCKKEVQQYPCNEKARSVHIQQHDKHLHNKTKTPQDSSPAIGLSVSMAGTSSAVMATCSGHNPPSWQPKAEQDTSVTQLASSRCDALQRLHSGSHLETQKVGIKNFKTSAHAQDCQMPAPTTSGAHARPSPQHTNACQPPSLKAYQHETCQYPAAVCTGELPHARQQKTPMAYADAASSHTSISTAPLPFKQSGQMACDMENDARKAEHGLLRALYPAASAVMQHKGTLNEQASQYSRKRKLWDAAAAAHPVSLSFQALKAPCHANTLSTRGDGQQLCNSSKHSKNLQHHNSGHPDSTMQLQIHQLVNQAPDVIPPACYAQQQQLYKQGTGQCVPMGACHGSGNPASSIMDDPRNYEAPDILQELLSEPCTQHPCDEPTEAHASPVHILPLMQDPRAYGLDSFPMQLEESHLQPDFVPGGISSMHTGSASNVAGGTAPMHGLFDHPVLDALACQVNRPSDRQQLAARLAALREERAAALKLVCTLTSLISEAEEAFKRSALPAVVISSAHAHADHGPAALPLDAAAQTNPSTLAVQSSLTDVSQPSCLPYTTSKKPVPITEQSVPAASAIQAAANTDMPCQVMTNLDEHMVAFVQPMQFSEIQPQLPSAHLQAVSAEACDATLLPYPESAMQEATQQQPDWRSTLSMKAPNGKFGPHAVLPTAATGANSCGLMTQQPNCQPLPAWHNKTHASHVLGLPTDQQQQHTSDGDAMTDCQRFQHAVPCRVQPLHLFYGNASTASRGADFQAQPQQACQQQQQLCQGPSSSGVSGTTMQDAQWCMDARHQGASVHCTAAVCSAVHSTPGSPVCHGHGHHVGMLMDCLNMLHDSEDGM